MLGVELVVPGELPVVPPVVPLVEPEPAAPMEELLLPVPPVPEPAVPAVPDGVVEGVVVELDELDPVVPSFLSQALSESAAATANAAIAI